MSSSRHFFLPRMFLAIILLMLVGQGLSLQCYFCEIDANGKCEKELAECIISTPTDKPETTSVSSSTTTTASVETDGPETTTESLTTITTVSVETDGPETTSVSSSTTTTASVETDGPETTTESLTTITTVSVEIDIPEKTTESPSKTTTSVETNEPEKTTESSVTTTTVSTETDIPKTTPASPSQTTTKKTPKTTSASPTTTTTEATIVNGDLLSSSVYSVERMRRFARSMPQAKEGYVCFTKFDTGDDEKVIEKGCDLKDKCSKDNNCKECEGDKCNSASSIKLGLLSILLPILFSISLIFTR